MAPKDLLFIVLCLLKAATNWDLMGEICEKKGLTLQRLFSHVVDLLSPLLYQDCINHYYSKLSMAHIIKKGNQFKHLPCALFVIDVIFQQGNRPSGILLEGKLYFSGKHKLYSYKTEVSVAPTGQAINVIDH